MAKRFYADLLSNLHSQIKLINHNLRFVTVSQRFEIIRLTCETFATLDGEVRQGFRMT